MRRSLITSFLVVISLMAGCGAISIPTATGDNPSLVLQVDCGIYGVAFVKTQYGTGEEQRTLLGRNKKTQSVGGLEYFENKYGSAPGDPEATLTVKVLPTRGTCTTTLTDFESGNVLIEENTAGHVTLEAIVPAIEN